MSGLLLHARALGIAAACACAVGAAAQTAELLELGYRFLPKGAFDLQVDSFEQLRPRDSLMCTLDDVLTSIRVLPQVEASQGFEVRSEPQSLEVSALSDGLLRPQPFLRIAQVGLDLRCEVRTMPRRDVAAAVAGFTAWAQRGALECTLKNGTTLLLTPEVPLQVVTPAVGSSGALMAALATDGATPEFAQIRILALGGGRTVEVAGGTSPLSATLDGLGMEVQLSPGQCTLRQDSAVFDTLPEERKALQQMRSLEPFLTPAQLNIFKRELELQAKLVREMEAQVAAQRRGSLLGEWLLLVTDPTSGRLYAAARVRGGQG